jgi:hypothetical protein
MFPLCSLSLDKSLNHFHDLSLTLGMIYNRQFLVDVLCTNIERHHPFNGCSFILHVRSFLGPAGFFIVSNTQYATLTFSSGPTSSQTSSLFRSFLNLTTHLICLVKFRTIDHNQRSCFVSPCVSLSSLVHKDMVHRVRQGMIYITLLKYVFAAPFSYSSPAC